MHRCHMFLPALQYLQAQFWLMRCVLLAGTAPLTSGWLETVLAVSSSMSTWCLVDMGLRQLSCQEQLAPYLYRQLGAGCKV